MKGIVFTEFLDFVEARTGLVAVEEMIAACDLLSGGAYSSVGTYDVGELVQILGQFTARTNVPPTQAVEAFGEHLFARFVVLFPAFFDGVTDALAFLEGVEGHIHVEVRKLYPDAELPHLATSRPHHDHLVLEYESSRGLDALANGLIVGCLRHFHCNATVERGPVAGPGGPRVRFDVRRVPVA